MAKDGWKGAPHKAVKVKLLWPPISLPYSGTTLFGGRRINSGTLFQPVDSVMVLTPKGSVTGGLLCIFQTLNTLGWLRQLFLCPLGLNLNLTKLCPVLVSRLKLHQAEVMAVLCTLLASITTTRVYSPTFPTRLCALMSWLCGIQAPPHSSFQLHSATKNHQRWERRRRGVEIILPLLPFCFRAGLWYW